jgi:hypothetical protein
MDHLCICPFILQNLALPLCIFVHHCHHLENWTPHEFFLSSYSCFLDPPPFSTDSYFFTVLLKTQPFNNSSFLYALALQNPLHIITHHSPLKNLTPCGIFIIFIILFIRTRIRCANLFIVILLKAQPLVVIHFFILVPPPPPHILDPRHLLENMTCQRFFVSFSSCSSKAPLSPLTHIVAHCSPLDNPTPCEFVMFSSWCFVNPPTPHRHMCTHAVLLTIVLLRIYWKVKLPRVKIHIPHWEGGVPKSKKMKTQRTHEELGFQKDAMNKNALGGL